MFVFKLGQVDVVQEWDLFFFSSFSFGSSQRDWILVFIMIFMKALKFKFAYLSEYALFSFSFCRKSQRSSSAGWCLQPCMWWMQVIQPVRTKQGFDDLALRSHETPLQHFGHFITYTSLDVLLLSELPQFFVAHSIFQWLDGILQLHHIQKGGGKTVVKRICIVNNHTQVASWS